MAIEKPSDRLFRYPPMERQDLNQSQLGSFKFTPVDNVSSLQAMATSYMNSQISAYLARAKATSASERPSHPSSGIVDADFFNKHIKPDLGDSRLRLGPAAVRSAVDGAATSPTRQDHMLADQTNSDRLNADCLRVASASPFHVQGRTPLTQGTVSQYQSPVSMNSQQEGHTLSPHHRFRAVTRYHPENNSPAPFSMSQTQDSNMETNNSPFMPINPGAVSIGFPDPALVNQSLTLALVTEQQGHELTRVALREEMQKSLRLQAELSYCNERIRKLQMRMKLMEDAPKENVSVETKSNSAHATNGHIEAGPVGGVVGQDNRQFPTKVANVIAHDDLQCEKSENATSGNPAEAKEGVAGAVKDAASEVDDSQFFNLGLLESPGIEDSLTSNARRILRKHFVIDPQPQTIATTPVQQRSDKLIEVSPESIKGEDQPVEPQVSKLLSLFQEPQTSSEPELTTTKPEFTSTKPEFTSTKPELTTTMSSSDAINNLRTSDKPVLELPASFLAKYGRKPVVTEEDGLKDGFYSFDGDWVEGISNTNKGNGSDDQDGLTGPNTPSTASTAVPSALFGEIPSKFPGQPMWKIHRDNPIFYDDSEKQRAKYFGGMPMDPTSKFYTHPVRYLPEDAMKSKDVFRTVIMDYIPRKTCANEVLELVSGGAVESIELVGPIGKATDFMSARLVFVLEEGAMAMARSNDLSIDGIKVHCWLVREPTYPRSGEMEEYINGIMEASRILMIDHLTIDQYTQIQGVVTGLGLGRQLIAISWELESRAVLEFTSIKAAVKAGQGIIKHAGYREATLSFDEDYTCRV